MKRGSGILMHVTSLPSPYGIGDMGPGAYKFADFLAETKQSYWQVLPLNPIDEVMGNSPYSSVSTFAGNTLLISPDTLVEEGLLTKRDIRLASPLPDDICNYRRVRSFKEKIFAAAHKAFEKGGVDKSGYDEFCSKNSFWLEDFALYMILKRKLGGTAWNEWPEELKTADGDALDKIADEHAADIEREKFLQWLFFKQWFALKSHCRHRNISIIGDIPIYVSYDSADVWMNQGIFKLDAEGAPAYVAGVPPDYFSKTGQLWGNPVYNWDILRVRNFDWWITRMEHNLSLFDIVRIDHFRGLVAFWEVPAGNMTAMDGHWSNVPAYDFFNTLRGRFPHMSIIAEDLGIITQDVRDILTHFGFPGMRVLLFAFNEDHPMHPYLPHTYENNCIVYTGTHDNNTVKGWFEREASEEGKQRLAEYLGKVITADDVNWGFVRLAMMSVANMTIIPMQDLLGLGEDARMNVPSTVEDNWEWRLLPNAIDSAISKKLQRMTRVYGRAVG